MLKLNMIYSWEMETLNGTILKQYNEDGTENSWKSLNPDEIIRVTFIPLIPVFAKHSVIIDISVGERFIKRFGRGFMKQKDGFQLSEYLNCVVTNKYRFYLFSSNGGCLITHKDREVYI